MTLNIKTVRYRLELILDYLEELRPLTALSLDEFLNDRYKIRAAERVLEITIQAALDINHHLIKEHFKLEKQSNIDGFLEIGQLGVITSELSQEIHQSGSFRNRLAHRYYAVDPEVVFQFIEKALNQYADYVQQIADFVDSLEDSNE